MTRRLAVATVILLHAGFFVLDEAPAPATRGESQVTEFRHYDHVRAEWSKGAEPEYKRDCQGCHRYESESVTNDPQGFCASCHANDALEIDPAKTTPGYLNDLDSLRKDRPFRHWFHKDYDCKLCHERNKADFDGPAEGRTGDVKYRSGWHTCVECHDPTGSRFNEGGKPDPKTFVDTLNRMLARNPERTGTEFRHDEHLASADDVSKCATCHQGLLQSKGADLATTEVASEACATCHIGKPPDGKVRPGLEDEAHDCKLLGTFPHDAHCDEDAASKDPLIKAKGCLACHESVQDGVTYRLQEKFRRDGYQACEECHVGLSGQWKWPRLVNTDGEPDHGKVGDCAACHEFGAGPMKTHRPQDRVTRRRPDSFALLKNDHPFITKDRDGKYKVDQSCKTCHRAGIDGGLPSRIGNKRFSHDTHLPANPTPADCNQCHGGVDRAADPASLLLYDETACAECHRGGKVTPVHREQPVEQRSVPRFPHQLHLTANAKKLDEKIRTMECLACHEPAQNGETDVGTLPDALDCSRCHDHGVKPELCADKDRPYVASCAKCHGPDGPDGEPVSDLRKLTSSLTGAQWHPTPDQTACSECHLPGASSFRLPTQVHVHAIRKYGKPPNGFHAGFDPNATLKNEKACTSCHWHEMMGAYSPTLSGAGTRDEQKSAAKKVRDLLQGYPGGDR